MMLILDDHPLVRQGLETIVKMHDADKKIVQAGSVEEAKSVVEEMGVSAAFVDLNLGKDCGFEFVHWLKQEHRSVKVFVITSSSGNMDFAKAKELEVDAYVLKDAFIDEIVFGLKVVERGGKFYSAALVEEQDKSFRDKCVLDCLTDREAEVLYELSKGYSNGVIADKLYISEGTVKKHISNILSKLDLKNRMEAIVFVNKDGALSEELRKRLLTPDRQERS